VFALGLRACIQAQGMDRGDKHTNSSYASLRPQTSSSGCNHGQHTGTSLARTPQFSQPASFE
jgi:hypothetical protein